VCICIQFYKYIYVYINIHKQALYLRTGIQVGGVVNDNIPSNPYMSSERTNVSGETYIGGDISEENKRRVEQTMAGFKGPTGAPRGSVPSSSGVFNSSDREKWGSDGTGPEGPVPGLGGDNEDDDDEMEGVEGALNTVTRYLDLFIFTYIYIYILTFFMYVNIYSYTRIYMYRYRVRTKRYT
jgi:hypothetical protein